MGVSVCTHGGQLWVIGGMVQSKGGKIDLVKDNDPEQIQMSTTIQINIPTHLRKRLKMGDCNRLGNGNNWFVLTEIGIKYGGNYCQQFLVSDRQSVRNSSAEVGKGARFENELLECARSKIHVL
ncbi:hypothetical protein CEXT_443621 [Caerostris extrusa]|uniref:Uncharacterized protein n=1 Tax=Caerostris extrusa TaxID=172846 RepID=A0AAV4SCH0_CAEEX|nr:hypothetical protein CEXT_443621 [Caerostris extrusa]